MKKTTLHTLLGLVALVFSVGVGIYLIAFAAKGDLAVCCGGVMLLAIGGIFGLVITIRGIAAGLKGAKGPTPDTARSKRKGDSDRPDLFASSDKVSASTLIEPLYVGWDATLRIVRNNRRSISML